MLGDRLIGGNNAFNSNEQASTEHHVTSGLLQEGVSALSLFIIIYIRDLEKTEIHRG